MQVHRQGETVSLTWSGYVQALPASGLFTIKDANGNVRTLANNERVIIDGVSLASTGQPSFTYVYTGSDYTGIAAGSVLIYSTSGAGNGQINTSHTFPGEGISNPLGLTPQVANADGVTAVIILTGRIVQDGTFAPTRANWKEALTGAGIPPGSLPSLRAMAPDGLPDGSQNNVSPNAPISKTANPSNSDPTPGSLNPPANGGSI